MNYKKLIYFIIVILSIGIASVFLHEFVHVIQFYYFYGIALEDMSLHFFWEFDKTGLSTKEIIFSLPAAWIDYENLPPGKTVNILFLEIPAYVIQYSFIGYIFFKYVYKNKKLNWRD